MKYFNFIKTATIQVVWLIFLCVSTSYAYDNPVAPTSDSNVVKPQPVCEVSTPVPVVVSAAFYEMTGPVLRGGDGVMFIKGYERFTASKVEYDTLTQIGYAQDVFFTTCSAQKPDWHLTASRVVLQPNHKLHARNVALYIGRTRVLILPSMKIRVGGGSATSAIFPRLGYDSRDGATLSQTLRVTDTTHSRTTLDLKFTTLHSIECALGTVYGVGGRLTSFPGRYLNYGSMRTRALDVPQKPIGNCDPQLLRPTGAAHLQPYGTITLRQRTYDARNLGLVVFRQPELGVVYLGSQLSIPKQKLDPRIELYPQITASWGRFKEIPGQSDYESRGQLAMQGSLNAFWMGPRTAIQPLAIATYAAYGDGQVFRTIGYGLDIAHIDQNGSYYSTRYINRSSSGSTPFLFDNIDIAKEIDLSVQRFFGKAVAGITLCYDAGTGSLFDWAVMAGRRSDCLGTYLRWDNRFKHFGFDIALLNF